MEREVPCPLRNALVLVELSNTASVMVTETSGEGLRTRWAHKAEIRADIGEWVSMRRMAGPGYNQLAQ